MAKKAKKKKSDKRVCALTLPGRLGAKGWGQASGWVQFESSARIKNLTRK